MTNYNSFDVSALRVHLSEAANKALLQFPGFNTESRGEILVKVLSIDYFEANKS